MSDQDHPRSVVIRFVREARRRRVFRTAALYIVGAWLLLQVADVLFPSFGIPDAAIQVLLFAAMLGFPIALIFGWMFDVGRDGVRRTLPNASGAESTSLALRRSDYVILAALAVVATLIVLNAARVVIETPPEKQSPEATDPGLTSLPKLDNSIAILPFANISNDPDNEFFCDGISEEILNRLGRFHELSVIGRTSSFAFKGKDVAAPRIATLLGVRFLLQGSVRKAGNQLRISAQLLDENGIQVWSDTFDRQLQDIFEIQSEIADVVAHTVVPHVASVTTYASPNLEAYEHYLEGREYLHQRQQVKARPELQKAISIDPKFADAYAELAIATLVGQPTSEALENAQDLIDTALTLQPGMPRARAAQALLYLQWRPPNPAATTDILRQVLLQDPNMSDAMLWLSNSLTAQGQLAESNSMLERAWRLDPLHPSITGNLAKDLFQRGDEDRASQILLRAIEGAPSASGPYLALSKLYESRGNYIKAVKINKQAILNMAAQYYFHVAKNYAELGNWNASRYWLQRSKLDQPDYPGTRFFDATLPWWQGHYAEAANLYQQALDAEGIVLTNEDPMWAQWQGWMQSPANDHERTIEILEPIVDRTQPPQNQDVLGTHAGQALAWAYIGADQPDEAQTILKALDDYFGEADKSGSLWALYIVPFNDAPYRYALNTRLMGDLDLALDRLERAVELGWRGYYVNHHDSRWDVLRDNPRFLKLMAFVKADVDAQRAEQDRIDAEDDFTAKLDAAMAAGD